MTSLSELSRINFSSSILNKESEEALRFYKDFYKKLNSYRGSSFSPSGSYTDTADLVSEVVRVGVVSENSYLSIPNLSDPLDYNFACFELTASVIESSFPDFEAVFSGGSLLVKKDVAISLLQMEGIEALLPLELVPFFNLYIAILFSNGLAFTPEEIGRDLDILEEYADGFINLDLYNLASVKEFFDSEDGVALVTLSFGSLPDELLDVSLINEEFLSEIREDLFNLQLELIDLEQPVSQVSFIGLNQLLVEWHIQRNKLSEQFFDNVVFQKLDAMMAFLFSKECSLEIPESFFDFSYEDLPDAVFFSSLGLCVTRSRIGYECAKSSFENLYEVGEHLGESFKVDVGFKDFYQKYSDVISRVVSDLDSFIKLKCFC